MYFLEDVLIEKKDGTLEEYSSKKLLDAVAKSAVRARGIIKQGDSYVRGSLTDDEEGRFLALVEKKILGGSDNLVKTATLHAYVEDALNEVAPDVGAAYINYHSFRMHQASVWERIYGSATQLIGESEDEDVLTLKQQNANADATLSSTKKCFLADYVGEAFYEEFFLTKEEKQAVRDGFIYVHDRNARMVYALNCCLFNMSYVMENGFEINGIHYNKPTELAKAFGVMGDLILINASQQYGGFTVPRVDTIIAPYAEKEQEKIKDELVSLGVDEKTALEEAEKRVKKMLLDGFQMLEMKLNTVASSRGDYPFTTFTLGLDRSFWGKEAAKACLITRMNGQGEKGKKKPVLFPKLVILFDKSLHGKGKELEDVYEAGLKCSSKYMYPDWLSLTGEGYVPSMYKKHGVRGVISPMGCRAFLSPYYEKGGFVQDGEDDQVVFEGRFNIGAVSLNLPMILAKAQKESKKFYDVLGYYLELIRNIHCRTYDFIGNMRAACNPIGFCYGGFYGGNLKPSDKVRPLLKAATASFGITALNELQMQYNKKTIREDGEFALEVMRYINDKLAFFKKEDGHLYAVYGTPAENLCGKQVKQYRSMFGIVEGVSSRPYVSNSFHCHVTEKMSPIEKQDKEYRFWDLFNGGKIQYCRYLLGYNVKAIETLILRAMDMGFYEGVNLSLDFCDDCGYSQVDMGIKCPNCGGYHITQFDRMNGYLGITRKGKETIVEDDGYGNKIVHIQSRFSPHKQQEIKDRISM